MSVLEEIESEIIQRHQTQKPESGSGKPEKKEHGGKKGGKNAMTKAEIEAYRQKMMEKEEARYLGKMPNASKPKANRYDKKKTRCEKTETKTKSRKAKVPKMLQPLEPLYLLQIPGLPKGDCLAICYARGADA